MPSLLTELNLAEAAAREAAIGLHAAFLSPGGPKGHGDHADADDIADALIRNRLCAAFPHDAYLGEETGRHGPANADRIWVVDPNDGTAAYMVGYRGSSVSIALISGGIPILGVVFAFCYPDDEGDMFSWCQGQPLRRNGAICQRDWDDTIDHTGTVLVSYEADRNPGGNSACVAPLRYRAMPSLAYRLALTAVGEATASVSVTAPASWDFAGGHALLLGAGGDLYGPSGAPIRYSRSGSRLDSGWTLAGPPAIVRHLMKGDWTKARRDRPADNHYTLVKPTSGGFRADAGMLSRAQGCLLGQLAGDSLGSLVEFQSAATIRRAWPNGLLELRDGGVWNTIAGQPTDDSEMALLLARALVRDGKWTAPAALAAYQQWIKSGPFDCGGTIAAALHGTPNHSSQANGAMMRISPLGIFGALLPLQQVADFAAADAALTHPHPICGEANALFAMAIAHAIRTGPTAEELYSCIASWAAERNVAKPLRDVIAAARTAPPADYLSSAGWVLIAFHNALWQLLHAADLAEGISDSAMRGGDTDTNAAIAGALLGAVYGRQNIPSQWQQAILACRPLAGLAGVRHPRPMEYWPVDAMLLAEALLRTGLCLPL